MKQPGEQHVKQPHVIHISTVHGALDGRIYYKEVRSLHDAGYDVVVAGTVDEAQEHDGVAIIPLGRREGPRWRRMGRDLRAMLVMLSHPQSIHHIHDPELLVAAFIPALLGRKLVYDVHEFYLERVRDLAWIPPWLRRPLTFLYDGFERTVLRRFAGVVIVSEEMRDRYRSIVGANRVALVRNFPNVSPRERLNAHNAPHPLGGRRYILHTGGASQLRAFHTMVAAAEYLRAEGCDWPVINLGPIDLSGYGDDAADLLARAERADIRNLGFLPQHVAWSYIAHADIGYVSLIPIDNYMRALPNKVFEYLIFGLPLVAPELRMTASIIRRGDAGLVVAPADDPKAHGAALLRLVQNTKLRARFAANSAAAGKNYRFDEEFGRLASLYERIDGARQGGKTGYTVVQRRSG